MIRPRPWVLALAAVSLLAAACQQSSNPPDMRPEVLAPEHVLDVDDVGLVEPRVTVISSVAPVDVAVMPTGRVNTWFAPTTARRVNDVREAVIDLRARGIANPSELSMELRQPDGALYEVRAAEIGGNASAEYRVRFILPVAGTAIDRLSLGGVWHADFLLAGEPLASGDFELVR